MKFPEPKPVPQGTALYRTDRERDLYYLGYNAAVEACKKAWEESQMKESHKCIVCGKEAFTDQLSKGWRCRDHALFGSLEQSPPLVALDEKSFPLMEIQRICGVGIHRAIQVRDLICAKFGVPESGLVPIDKEKLTDALKDSAMYALAVRGISFYIPSNWPQGVREFYLELYDQMMGKLSKFGTPSPALTLEDLKCMIAEFTGLDSVRDKLATLIFNRLKHNETPN